MKYIVILILFYIKISIQYHLNYQAHGFNDLDYFLQIAKKGVNIFKFDVNLSIKQSCIEKTTWQEGDGECELLKYGLPSCCLVFRGDQSTSPIWNYASNTTQDFVHIFDSGKYDYIFSKENALPRYQEKKLIAINFQYGPYAVNGLTTTFLYDLFKTIIDRNLNIEIIFGRDEFITDYDDLCILKKCNAKQQYISDFPVILQSDEDKLPLMSKSRRFNFNTNYYNIETFCKNGFPKWVTEDNEFPMIFWEPSHEDGMQWTFQKWFNYTCNKPYFKDQLLDYQQANNQEPEMQQVYLQGFNETINGQKYVLENKDSPILEYLQEADLFLLGYQNTNTKISQLTLVDSEIQVISKIKLAQKPEKIKKTELINQKNNYLIMVIEQSIAQLFQTNVNDQSIQQFKQLYIRLPENFLAGDIVTISGIYGVYFLKQKNENYIQLEFHIVTENNQQKLGNVDINIQQYGINGNDIINVDFSIMHDQGVVVFNLKEQKSKLYSIFIDLYEFQNSNRFLSKKILQKIKYSSFQKINHQNNMINNFAFGEKPIIKLYLDEATNEVYFLITATNAFSQSGVTFNNNNFNKCKYFKYKGFEQLLNMPYVMTYMYGQLSELQLQIKNNEIITGCSSTIQHASFNNGDNPQIILKKNPNLEDENEYYYQAYVLHNYVDYDDLPGPTKLYCGSSGQYLPNDYSETPRPWQTGPIPKYKNSLLFEYFSVLPFDVFPYFAQENNEQTSIMLQKSSKEINE